MVEGENEDKDAHSASEAENQFLIFLVITRWTESPCYMMVSTYFMNKSGYVDAKGLMLKISSRSPTET